MASSLTIECSKSLKTVAGYVSDAKGVHDLYLVFKGSGEGNLFKFDYWKFCKK